ncbi:hypothetical protein ACYRFS_12100 [Listeria kieliensis]|uniref:hypothetical protein n=1 Tax=Listeria aquatica TaxID=1494960 RepID=UPI003F6E5653
MTDGFPKTVSQYLAMQYLQSQDLSKNSPEEIAKIYYDALKDIHFAINEKSEIDDNGNRIIKL